MPFVHPELLQETWWVLEDPAGNSYTKNMVVYSEQIAGLNCINVTSVLDGEEFLNLDGKELGFSAICSEQKGAMPDAEASIRNTAGYGKLCQKEFIGKKK